MREGHMDASVFLSLPLCILSEYFDYDFWTGPETVFCELSPEKLGRYRKGQKKAKETILSKKRNYKRSLITTLSNPHGKKVLKLTYFATRFYILFGFLEYGFRTCKKEEASVEGNQVMIVIEKLFCSIRLDICYRNHVVEESMDHGIDQVLIYASV
uniref:Uncharacterized protein n=1 Tax=Cucumis melo TaxID=3656 RepID=A0A9I9ELG8_CUCME